MYTEEGDTPLGEVFESISRAYGAELPEEKDVISSHESLQAFMDKVLPSYDEERVHDSDIKKLVKWYLILRRAVWTLLSSRRPEKTVDEKDE